MGAKVLELHKVDDSFVELIDSFNGDKPYIKGMIYWFNKKINCKFYQSHAELIECKTKIRYLENVLNGL